MNDIFKNIRGTTRDVFKIGKDGANIFVRDTKPTSLLGFNGDWCLLHSTHPIILKKQDDEWIDINARNLITTTTSLTYVPVSHHDVIMCNNTTNITITIDAVPLKGHTLDIKDANGNAAQNNITVTCTNGITIDGETSILINNDYTALSLLSDGTDLYLL